jgi:hypothetical protein
MIDRRTFNKMAGLAGLSALAGRVDLGAEQNPPPDQSAAPSIGQPAPTGDVILEDDQLLVGFDANSGVLTRFERKSTNWILERRPELGVSFRLHAPMPDRRDNFVLGKMQRAAKVEKLSERELLLEWKDLLSEHGGILPITLTAKITLQNGALTFDSTLINDSAMVVETIDYPYFGDLNPPARDTPMVTRIMRYDNLESTEIYPHFANEKGYWGDDFPTKTLDSSYSLFCLIQSTREGLYVETHDPNSTYLLQYTFEQHPGVLNNLAPFSSAGSDEVDQHLVPKDDEISGIPVHLEFRTCHFVFAQPHSTTSLVPVVLRCYSGDWHAGIDLYKHWRATWFVPPQIPAWVKEVHSWQQLQVNSPEEEFRIPYAHLLKYGEECAKNDVKAIQLVGWNHGGQDRGNPSQDTDPGLGTWKELHDAIAQIQAMGVKIILFGKFPWADMTTDWYKRELYKYATTDPYGIPYRNDGDSYHTPTQLAGINNRPFAVMDFLSPAYRDIATLEFKKLLALGSAGWLYDEVCDVVAGKYNFASGHGYPAPGYIYAGVIPLAHQLRAAADQVNPEFLFAGEGPQDWLTQYYPVSYFRGSSTPIERYIDPQGPMMVAVNGFDDREQLNRILLYRYIISYEPFNFKGNLTDFPLTLAYGQKIDALRRKYKAQLWDSEFRDTLGANVTADGSHRYTVFVTPEGKRSIVVVNQEFNKPIAATLELPNSGSLVVATPENPDAQPTSSALQIPARSAAVIMEQ